MANLTFNLKTFFSDQALDIIRELTEKYELQKHREEIMGQLRRATTLGEKAELFNDLPSCQMFVVVIKMAENKAGSKELSIDLEKGLKLSPQKAEDLVDELKNRVLVLVEKRSSDKEKTAPLKTVKSPPVKQDAYREATK